MITYVKLENVGPFHSFELKPGPGATLIQGCNGAGKSTVVNAIKNVVDGGVDGDLIRKGQPNCKITLKLSDGSTFVKTMQIDPDTGKTTYNLTGTGPNGKALTKVKTRLDEAIAKLAFDPEELFRMTPALRLKAILKSMDVSFDPVALNKVFAADPAFRPLPEETPIELEDLDELIAGSERRRTEANTSLRDLQGAIATQQQALPPDDGTDWVAAVMEAEEAYQKVANERRARELQINRDRDEAVARISASLKTDTDAALQDYAARADRISADKKAAIQAAEAKAAEETSIAQLELERIRQRLSEAANANRTAATVLRDELIQTEVTPLYAQEGDKRIELARVTDSRRRADEAVGIRKAIDSLERQRKEYAGTVAVLDRVVESARLLRVKALERLPIKGLTVEGKKMYVNGIEWEHLNTATRRGLTQRIGNMHKGKMQVRIIDDAADFDEENLAAIAADAEARGMQILIARVSDSPQVDIRPLKGQR